MPGLHHTGSSYTSLKNNRTAKNWRNAKTRLYHIPQDYYTSTASRWKNLFTTVTTSLRTLLRVCHQLRVTVSCTVPFLCAFTGCNPDLAGVVFVTHFRLVNTAFVGSPSAESVEILSCHLRTGQPAITSSTRAVIKRIRVGPTVRCINS